MYNRRHGYIQQKTWLYYGYNVGIDWPNGFVKIKINIYNRSHKDTFSLSMNKHCGDAGTRSIEMVFLL